MDREGQVLVRRREVTCSTGEPEAVVEQAARMAEQLIAELGIDKKDILGTGVGVPGPLDFDRGIVLESPNLCWSQYPVKDELSKRLGTKLLLDKDTNVAALGEFYFGLNQRCRNLVYITVSTGIGGGIIAEGRLLHGQSGGAGELGHMVLDAKGRRCGCGRTGCLEALASGTALALDARELIARGQGKKIAAFCPEDSLATAHEVGMAARQGDKEANELVKKTAGYLGMAIANLVNLLNPERIVIGGGMGLGLKDLLLPPIQEYVYANIFALHRRKLEIEFTSLGDDIVLLGSAAMVLKTEGK